MIMGIKLTKEQAIKDKLCEDIFENVLKNDLILNKTYQSWVNLQYDLYKCLVYKLLENHKLFKTNIYMVNKKLKGIEIEYCGKKYIFLNKRNNIFEPSLNIDFRLGSEIIFCSVLNGYKIKKTDLKESLKNINISYNNVMYENFNESEILEKDLSNFNIVCMNHLYFFLKNSKPILNAFKDKVYTKNQLYSIANSLIIIRQNIDINFLKEKERNFIRSLHYDNLKVLMKEIINCVQIEENDIL